MVVSSMPDNESDPTPVSRKRKERVGAYLIILVGAAVVIKSGMAFQHGGFWAEVKIRASSRGWPWFVTMTIGLFGVVGGAAVLAARKQK